MLETLRYVYYIFVGIVTLGVVINITEGSFDIFGFIAYVSWVLAAYLLSQSKFKK